MLSTTCSRAANGCWRRVLAQAKSPMDTWNEAEAIDLDMLAGLFKSIQKDLNLVCSYEVPIQLLLRNISADAQVESRVDLTGDTFSKERSSLGRKATRVGGVTVQ